MLATWTPSVHRTGGGGGCWLEVWLVGSLGGEGGGGVVGSLSSEV